MNPECAVVVLGGNAFAAPDGGLTMAGQFAFAGTALAHLAPLSSAPTKLLLSHGNGPQVGHMLLRAERAAGDAYDLPLHVCVAESQGELGYVLQQSLRNVLRTHGIERPVVSVITEVEVDPGDPAFADPDKPIGPRYPRALAAEGWVMKEQPGGGFRRVVASPRPLVVVELESIRALLDLGVVVVAAGGGGVPVVREAGLLRGVDAVIDKDRTAALLADRLGADLLLILTNVPCAYTDFATRRQRPIGAIARADLAELARAGHFAAGSMGPKIEAVLSFTSQPGRTAIICDPASLPFALDGSTRCHGTLVYSDS